MLATAEPERDDRLWPTSNATDATNIHSIAYGACGPLLFLMRSGHVTRLPAPIRDWLQAHPARADQCPPGLYLGLAGIALTLEEAGLAELAAEAERAALTSPIRFVDPGMLLGAAGWGLAALERYRATGAGPHLDAALTAGEHLIATARRDADGVWWTAHDGHHRYGFGHGAAGIALFLAYLYVETGRPDFRSAANSALQHDLARRFESENGWLWPRYEGDNMVRPYWIEGSAGVASAALRIGQLLADDQHMTAAQQIADRTKLVFSALPSLFDGLTGIGELMVDTYLATGDGTYLACAGDIAESLLLFGVRRPEGLLWPGRDLANLSSDYAFGAAGAGLFLARLRHPGPRPLMDLTNL